MLRLTRPAPAAEARCPRAVTEASPEQLVSPGFFTRLNAFLGTLQYEHVEWMQAWLSISTLNVCETVPVCSVCVCVFAYTRLCVSAQANNPVHMLRCQLEFV